MGQRYHLDDTTKYVRDGHSKAIISTDVAGLSAYKARKNKDREQTKGVTPEEIADFVKSLGKYKIYKLSGTKERVSKLIEIKTNDDLPSHDNIFCIPVSFSTPELI